MDTIKFIKALFFIEGDVTLEGDTLQWETGFFIFKRKHSVNLRNLYGLLPYRKLWNNHPRVALFDYDEQRLLPGVNQRLKLKSTEDVENLIKLIKETGLAPVYSNDVSYATANDTEEIDSLLSGESILAKSSDLVLCYSEHAYGCSVWGRKLVLTNRIPYNEIEFVSNGKTLYFGGKKHQYISKKSFTKEDVNDLREKLSLKGAKIGNVTGTKYDSVFAISNLWKKSRWFRKESITVGDDAILYEYSKGKKSDSIYLPFDTVYFSECKKNILTGTIKVFGTQNVEPICRFSNEAVSAVKETLGSVKIPDGECYCSYAWFLKIFPLWPKNKCGRILLSTPSDSDSAPALIITPSKEDKDNKNTKACRIECSDITGYASQKKHWCSFFVQDVIVSGYENFRKDQGGTEVFFKFRKFKNGSGLINRLKELQPNPVNSKSDMRKLLKK